MNTLKWLGILLLFASGLLFGYEALSVLMQQDSHMISHSLTMILGSAAFDWIGALPAHMLRSGANYIVNMPLYAFAAAVGVVFLVISGIFAK